jgi:DNA polymerase elongation subunit (family B)
MSIYGDMLTFFPELKKKYVAFQASPTVKGGYADRRNERTIVGILQFVKLGEVLPQNDLEDDVEVPAFWTKGELEKDSYIVDEDGVIYKRTKVANWKATGNFRTYILETVIGVFDNQVDNPAVTTTGSRYV